MIRMSRYFDVGQNAVLFFDTMLPMDAFLTTGDSAEMNLVNQIFEFVKCLAEVQLSETALALFSAYILLQEGIIIGLIIIAVVDVVVAKADGESKIVVAVVAGTTVYEFKIAKVVVVKADGYTHILLLLYF